MPYASNGHISTDPIEGGIEISDEQYRVALEGMQQGQLVVVRDGTMAVEDPPEPEKEPDPEPLPVLAVTAAQGGIALIQAGLMDAVQAVVDASDTPPEIRWAWDRALTWEWDSPALAYLVERVGITLAQKAALFAAAAEIQA